MSEDSGSGESASPDDADEIGRRYGFYDETQGITVIVL